RGRRRRSRPPPHRDRRSRRSDRCLAGARSGSAVRDGPARRAARRRSAPAAARGSRARARTSSLHDLHTIAKIACATFRFRCAGRSLSFHPLSHAPTSIFDECSAVSRPGARRVPKVPWPVICKKCTDSSGAAAHASARRLGEQQGQFAQLRIADLTHSSPRPHDTRTSRAQSRTAEDAAPWILAALLSIGRLLRRLDLGARPFRWDEALSSPAAKAIAMHGIPELPSGMIYPRSLPFLYVLAGSGMLFGFDEWSLRLPAVLFGVASIALAFAFGKSLFDTKVGLVMAALVTFSAWDIEFSRYARMYAPFAFFYVLTLLAIWRYLVAGRSRAGAALAIVLALAALSLHELAYSLALAFLLPIVIDGRRTLAQPGRPVLPPVGFASVAAAFFVWARIQDRLFDRPAMLAAGGAEAPADLPLPTLEDSGAAPGGPLALLWRIVSAVRPPDLPAFSALLDTAPAAALAFPALALLAAGVFV